MTTSMPILLTMSPVELLTSSPIPELRRLNVTESDDEVIIEGRVSSYYLKQLAQEAIRCAVGCKRLSNKVVVGS